MTLAPTSWPRGLGGSWSRDLASPSTRVPSLVLPGSLRPRGSRLRPWSAGHAGQRSRKSLRERPGSRGPSCRLCPLLGFVPASLPSLVLLAGYIFQVRRYMFIMGVLENKKKYKKKVKIPHNPQTGTPLSLQAQRERNGRRPLTVLIWKFWGTGGPAPGSPLPHPLLKRRPRPAPARFRAFSFPLIGRACCLHP